MTTSEPMSLSAITSIACDRRSSGETVYSVLPFTRRMSLTFMAVSSWRGLRRCG